VSKKSNAEKDSSRVPHLFLWRSLGSSSFLIFTSHLKQCTCTFFLSGVTPRGSLRLEIGFWDTCKGFIILFCLLLMMMAFRALRKRCGKQLPHLEQDIQRYFPPISLLLLFFAACKDKIQSSWAWSFQKAYQLAATPVHACSRKPWSCHSIGSAAIPTPESIWNYGKLWSGFVGVSTDDC